MRILFLSRSYPIYGGVEQWLVDLSNGLRERGIECLVALADGFRFHSAKRFSDAYPILNTIVMDGTTGSATGRKLAVERVIAETRPDVVIPIMLADGLAGAISMKPSYGYSIVYPVHEITEGVAIDIAQFGSMLDRIVYVDKLTFEMYSQNDRETKYQNQLIPCGVPVKRLEHTEGQDDFIRILYCGRLEEVQKRVMDLVFLSKQLQELGVAYKLIIVGEGSARPNLENALRAEIDKNKVCFVGPKSRDEIYASYYPNTDVLIITSDWETGPLVAFEAMMNRCLVVTADFEGRRKNGQLIDRENCLVFPIGKLEEAAQKIKWAINNQNDAQIISERGYQYASSSRTTEVMIDKWTQMFDELIPATPVSGLARSSVVRKNEGRLGRLGIPDWLAEKIRRATGRRFVHASAGEEWPRYTRPLE